MACDSKLGERVIGCEGRIDGIEIEGIGALNGAGGGGEYNSSNHWRPCGCKPEMTFVPDETMTKTSSTPTSSTPGAEEDRRETESAQVGV